MKVLGPVVPLLLAVTPACAEATLHLLDEQLHLPQLKWVADTESRAPDLSVSRALWAYEAGDSADGASGTDKAHEEQKSTERPKEAPKPGSLDFDLLGAPPKTQEVNEKELRLRRTLLTVHQGVGLGMFALQLATTVVGQLNYDDKFGGDNTSKYVEAHAILAYATLASFAAAGTLALLAPAPIKRSEGFDRVSLHKLSMFTATAGMVAQGVLGVWTQSREGYLNQQSLGTAHLVVGYVTLAAVAVGVGALVF